jgi:hypothetical protein
MRLLALSHPLAIPFAEPYLGLPADGLARGGELLPTPWQGPPDVGRVPLGPSPFDHGTTRMRRPRCGHAARLTTAPTGICRGRQPQIMHALAGMLDARQVAQFGHGGHGDGALDTPQRREGLDHGSEAPSFDPFLEFLVQALEAFGVFADSPHILLEDDLLGWRWTDDFREPSEMCRAPMGRPRIATVLS